MDRRGKMTPFGVQQGSRRVALFQSYIRELRRSARGHASKPIGVYFECRSTGLPARLSGFRPRFVETLEQALAVCPQARVDLQEKSVLLHPSPPPVRPRLIA